MKYYLLCCILITGFLACAQKRISGIIRQNDSVVLAYVNIGIKQKNVGVVSNQKGAFTIGIPEEHTRDSLTFSYVGFEELTVPIADLNSATPNNILLVAKIAELPPITIKAKERVQKKIGVKSSSPILSSPSLRKKDNDILEFAQYIDIANKPSQLLSTSIMLKARKSDTISIRINLYSNGNGLPSERLNGHNIVVRVPVNNKWVRIDLSSYDIRLDKNFFISYEFLPDDVNHFFTYGAQFGGSITSRYNSLGSWTKTKGASFAAYVTIQQ